MRIQVEQASFDQGGRRVQPRCRHMTDSDLNERSIKDRRMANASLDEARLRQQAIGVKLRQMFDEVVSEPVPNEFLDILRRADDKSADRA